MQTKPSGPPFEFNPTVRLLFVNVAVLMAIGLLMVYSASLSANPEERYTQFTKQLVFVPLALGAMLVMMRFPFERLGGRRAAVGLLVLGVTLLGAVLFLGPIIGGSRRWFRFSIGPLDLSVQPSEIAKLCMVIFFAWLLSRVGDDRRRLRRAFGVLAVVLLLVCGLIGYQDLGTAALLAAVGFGLMAAGGIPWRYLLGLVAPAVGGLVALVVFFPYRLKRITIYLNPWKDPQGAGYQIIQSLIAIGSGGWAGLGMGSGMQKYFYLPEDTTDFIFSIICEEMGVAGGTLIIVLFLTMTLLGLRVVLHTTNRFAYLMSLGIVLWIGLQSLINIGVATAALPTKGIALPLVSYGGTGLVLTATALGLMMSVAGRSPGLDPQTADLAGTGSSAPVDSSPYLRSSV